MEINASTMLCGLIGHPVKHSHSPFIHSYLAEKMGINMTYLAFDVKVEKFINVVNGLDALNAIGANVTVPYKRGIIPYLCEIDEDAKKIGAVNTLVKCQGGYKGYNTDMPGFIKALESDKVDIKGKNCILLGSGGVCNAIIPALIELDAKNIVIINRNINKAQNLKDKFDKFLDCDKKTKIYVANMNEDYCSFMDNLISKDENVEKQWIAIQATSVGMYPDIDNVVLDNNDFYKRVFTGYDVIFNPEETKFMKKCKEAGAKAYNGLKMLTFQGVRAFELWNNVCVPEDVENELYEILFKKCSMNTEEHQ